MKYATSELKLIFINLVIKFCLFIWWGYPTSLSKLLHRVWLKRRLSEVRFCEILRLLHAHVLFYSSQELFSPTSWIDTFWLKVNFIILNLLFILSKLNQFGYFLPVCLLDLIIDQRGNEGRLNCRKVTSKIGIYLQAIDVTRIAVSLSVGLFGSSNRLYILRLLM